MSSVMPAEETQLKSHNLIWKAVIPLSTCLYLSYPTYLISVQTDGLNVLGPVSSLGSGLDLGWV